MIVMSIPPDVLREIGALAFGSRLKRLSDRVMQDGGKMYRASGLDFEPKWFPVYYYLSELGSGSIMDIARGLGVSHPSVNQIAREMISANLISASRDMNDKRRRVLALTIYGEEQRESIQKIWQVIEATLVELLAETGIDFLSQIGIVERALDRRSLESRFLDKYSDLSTEFEIKFFDIALADALADAFRLINEEWINEDFTIEESDRVALSDPKGYIIDPGGEIIFACEKSTGKAFGTCALIKRSSDIAELAKMGVYKSGRGNGLGKLEKASAMGFRKVYLETNSKLVPALGLYRHMGFVQVPFPRASDYNRADVYMEIELLQSKE
jgi:DNA-binding MarR family transcriptional regulator